MGHAARTRPKQFRRAVAGSVAVHLLLAVVVVVWVRSGGSNSPGAGQPNLDTRANEIILRLPSVEVTLPAAEPSKPPDPVPPPQPAEAVAGSRPPLANVVPNRLPNEVLALIRRLARDAKYKEDQRQLVVPIPKKADPAEFLVGFLRELMPVGSAP